MWFLSDILLPSFVGYIVMFPLGWHLRQWIVDPDDDTPWWTWVG